VIGDRYNLTDEGGEENNWRSNAESNLMC